MSPETIKSITDALKPLAEKIGAGASHLYGVFVQQQIAVGVAELVGSAFALVTVVVTAVVAYKAYLRGDAMKKEDWRSSYEGWFAVSIVGAFLSSIAAIVMVGLLTDGILHLLSPEYYALKDILCTAKGGCQ